MNEQLGNADKRRELRRNLERDSSSLDKFSMNDLMLGAVVIIAMIISFTDFTFSFGDFKNLTALTILLYVVTTFVYRNRYDKGKARGKKDEEYISSLHEYRAKRQEIYDRNIASDIPAFCRDYKVRELREYRENLLADIDMDYDEYKEKYQRKSDKSIMKMDLPLLTRKTLIICNHARPIRLVPGLLLNENGEADRNNIIGQSGRERERKDKRREVINRGVTVLFGSMIAINIIMDFSVVAIFQWLVRMIPILTAFILGEDTGYCNIAVTEINFKKDQTSVIRLFFEYEKANGNIVDIDKPEPAADAVE